MSATESSVRVQLLGRLRAWRDGTEVALGPPKQRALLGLLAARLNEAVGSTEIIDAIWGDTVPASATGGVHTYVAGLRKALEPQRSRRESGDTIVSAGGGYTLVLPPESVDVRRFTAHLATARSPATDRDTALREFGAALALWRGEAYASVPGPFAQTERARLQELRLTAVEEWGAAMLEAGRHAELQPALADMVAKNPLRERLRWLLMLALYRSGRQAHALTVYRETHRLLTRELGIEPGPELQSLHEQILGADPDLAPAPAASGAAVAPPPGAAAPRPAQLPPGVRGFEGRTAELARLREFVTAERDRDAAEPAVVVIDGPPGVGKTMLAISAAHRLSAHFPDGQLFVDLRGFDPAAEPLDASAALASLLDTLGVSRDRIPADPSGRAALYRSVLHGRRVLIMLDDALDPDQLRPLIPGGPACVLVTSRRRLSGLVARDGAHRLPLAPLRLEESVRLLTYLIGADRVAAQREDVVRIAEMCGNLPLPLRLAAEQLTADPRMPLAELVERYTPGQARLDGLAVENDPLATLRSVFGSSYRALPAEAARLYRLLGAYGSPAVEFAEVVALAGRVPADTRRLLDVLVDNHLLEEDGDTFRFHPLLGTYAGECAVEEPEDSQRAARARVLHYQRSRGAGGGPWSNGAASGSYVR
ncbi:BTAD domain-containing putative transcriptional regulator [Actinomadura sp. WMMB 499]|uniref:AfsR/SARP family transcriptional regulator n=1 Tax=Actinomadura sp. WMMB 499 TaxID=1219491 RepID=UPI00124939C4|nr:BTAD domain-containing putative transcriptional regulator [Actinomadura sp. WMMB 499]QFG24776.1 AfsR family transcriptional regulator [Actinomadura sp. WMMB 499]